MNALWREGTDQDHDLVRALRRAEPRAVGLLIDRHGTRIHWLASQILDDPRDVEEVTQHVLVTIVREIQTFRGAAMFSSWIYRITATAAFGRLWKTHPTRSGAPLDRCLPAFDAAGRHTEPVSDWSGPVDGPVMATELKHAIERGLRKLPADHRAILLLRDVEGLPTEEVAGILSLTIPAVKSRVHRARLFLRKKLAPVLSCREAKWVEPPQRSGRSV